MKSAPIPHLGPRYDLSRSSWSQRMWRWLCHHTTFHRPGAQAPRFIGQTQAQWGQTRLQRPTRGGR